MADTNNSDNLASMHLTRYLRPLEKSEVTSIIEEEIKKSLNLDVEASAFTIASVIKVEFDQKAVSASRMSPVIDSINDRLEEEVERHIWIPFVEDHLQVMWYDEDFDGSISINKRGIIW